MKYEIIMKNHLNLDLIKWFCLLTFLSQVLCHSLHLSGSYQESRVPGRELRKDMDWILKINDTLCNWLSFVRKLRKEWKPSRAPGGQRRLTCAFAPPTRKSSTPPSMPLKHFHVCHFVFVLVWSHFGLGKSLISHSWGSSQLTGLAWLAEVKFFFSSSKSVQQWSLCLWCFRFSVGTVSQSQRLQGVTVGWAFLGLLAEETLWTPQRSFYDYFPYQTWYIFSLLYWLCSYRCCWWTCFCCWLIVIVPG